MKTILLTLSFILSTMLSVFAQRRSDDLLQWDGFRIPLDKRGVKIGQAIDSASDSRFKLICDTAKLFRLSKDGVLRLRKNRFVSADKGPHSYGISLEKSGQLYHIELVKDEFIRNKVIAHRGAWRQSGVMQNSIRSFQEAVALGCEGSEFDVWLSGDNVVVLSHDPHIGGLEVEKSTAQQLYHATASSGDPVPALEDFIRVAKKQNKTKMVLEIKASQNGRSMQLTDSVVTIVHRLKAQGYVEYISFDYAILKRIRQLDPTAMTAYLYGNKTVEELYIDGVSGLDYDFYHYRNDPDLVLSAKKYGLITNVWTVNERSELALYLDKDVDMITTDEPELLLEIINRRLQEE